MLTNPPEDTMAPRLRTLYVGTETLGEASMQHYVLVLDDLTTQQVKDIAEIPIEHKAEGDYVPPILAFPFQVELPETGPDTFEELVAGLPDDQARKVREYTEQLAAQYRIETNATT